MKKFFKANWKTLLFFALAGLIGGYFVGLYILDGYPAEIRRQVAEQGLGDMVVAALTAVQYAWYGAVLGAAGIYLGKKIGLWKGERSITKKPLLAASAVGVVGGLALILPDMLYFGKHSQAIADSYAVKPTLDYVFGMVVLGGVTEEVMLRLFAMSLAALLLHKAFAKGAEKVSEKTLMTANIIAAVLFAAGHLPATAMLLGLTPMTIFRCFLLNGGFGLAFGWLYRKHGLRYAMIAHGGCHVVSKLIWILFI